MPSPGEIFASKKTGFYTPTLFVCGQSGYPKGCAVTDYNNLAPRFGISWAMNPKTVVRAGAGIYYANSDYNPLFRLAAGPAQQPQPDLHRQRLQSADPQL